MSPGSLSERFRKNRSSSLTSEHGLVFSVYRKRVHVGDVLSVTRIRTSPSRVQILNLHVNGALLAVNGVAASAVSFRSDTSPVQISVDVESTVAGDDPESNGIATEVEIWNGWIVDDVEHAWVGDAGIRIRATNPLTLECSDGLAEGDFNDLVVEIAISTAAPGGSDEEE